MPIHPRESREAHSQSLDQFCVAASMNSRPQDSLSPRNCDPRDPQPASGRGALAGQPFPLLAGGISGPALRPRRAVPPIPRHLLADIQRQDRAFNQRIDHPQALFFIGLIALATLIAGLASLFA